MNTYSRFLLLLLCYQANGQLAQQSTADFQIVERGAHHQVRQHVAEEQQADGSIGLRTNSFVQLETGLHYWKDGAWHDTNPRFSLFPGGAIANEGPFQLIVAPDIISEGAVDLLTPEGQRFISSPRWLAYYNTVTKESTIVAAVKSCQGQLIEPNVIVFHDAFDDVQAALRYTYHHWGIEQDVILLEAFNPGEWGLQGNPADIVLEMWTEFHSSPAPSMEAITEAGNDTKLEFQATIMGPGKAFSLGDEADTAPVRKAWTRIGQQQFLIEATPENEIARLFAKAQQGANARPVAKKIRGLAQQKPAFDRTGLLAQSMSRRRAAERKTETASIKPANKPLLEGVVMDYTLVTTTNNFRFKSDTTYYVSGSFNLGGTNVLEGGTVIKFAPTNGAQIQITGSGATLTSLSTAYRPVIITARDDNSVGEAMGSGIPAAYNTALRFNYVSSGVLSTLNDLRVCYATNGIYYSSGSGHVLRNVQFYKCRKPIVTVDGSYGFYNGLIFDAESAFDLNSESGCTAEHLTFHIVKNLQAGAAASLILNNCLLISVTNTGSYSGLSNQAISSDSGIFQTMGSGARYLAASSPYRNLGSTSIDSTLLNDLKRRTTYPPLRMTNIITANTNLSPKASRDTDLPDLGYHYDPIDFMVSDLGITNITLTLTNGVVVSTYPSATNEGILLAAGGKLLSFGNPTNRNVLTRSSSVQETPGGNYTYPLVGADINADNQTLRSRFTDWCGVSASGDIISAYYMDAAPVEFSHSQFFFGWVRLKSSPMASTNCLWERTTLSLNDDGSTINAYAYNNLFFGGTTVFNRSGAGTFLVNDSVFDQATITQNGVVTHNYNAYFSVAAQLTNSQANGAVLTTNIYVLGPLGNYYYPTSGSGGLTNLFNAGSRNATNASLFHFTTTTNQLKETNSIVDIGFHYVALSAQTGLPIDTDGDGIPDFIEDANGNGSQDSGETSYVDPKLVVQSDINYLKGSTPLAIDTNATVSVFRTDNTNFYGGQLTSRIVTGAETDDALGIRHQGTNAGQIGVSGTNLTYGGTSIGNFTGGSGTNALTVNLNSNVWQAPLQGLLRDITFYTSLSSPASNRTVRFDLTDGKGGTNVPVSTTLHAICPPKIDMFLVLDVSTSLTNQHFVNAKAAASNFVAQFNPALDRIGLISFAGDTRVEHGLTTNFSTVQQTILTLTNRFDTIMSTAIDAARTNLSQTSTNTVRLMAVLSDGFVWPESDTNATLTNAAFAKESGIRIVSLDYIGPEFNNTNLMRDIACALPDYFYVNDSSLFQSNMTWVTTGLCRVRNNTAPTVSVDTPTNGQVFAAPANITISVSASDSDGGSVTNVAIYNGAVLLTNLTASPYALTLSSVLGSTNKFYAIAKDNEGVSTTSATNVVTVAKQFPIISLITPLNSTAFSSPVTNWIRTDARDADGVVTNVTIYTNGVVLAVVTNLPFHFVWTNPPVGTHTLYAKATDNDGQATNSFTNSVTVSACADRSIHSFTLTPVAIFGGNSSTGSININLPALAGGQAITLQADRPEVSIPASVWVPYNTTNVSFLIETRLVTNSVSANITVKTSAGSSNLTLSLQPTNFTTLASRGQCGPMDVVFIVDTTPSAQKTKDAFVDSRTNILDTVSFASGGDFRLGLVTLDANLCPMGGTCDRIFVRQTLTTNVHSFVTNVTQMPGVGAGDAGWRWEAWDEALNTIVNGLSAGRTTSCGALLQTNDFSTPFREHARKIIVLFTDNAPSGTDGDLWDPLESTCRHASLSIL